MELERGRLLEAIRDAIVQKRVIKWGYVRQFGGPSPSECDTVAGHTAAVSTIAVVLAHQYHADLLAKTGIDLKLADVALMALFHDLGEGRSGDTGAAGHGVYAACHLYHLERDGLAATVDGLAVGPKVLSLFDDYRQYGTPEAILVHIADNIEGAEKGFSIGGESTEAALRILRSNVELYREKHRAIPTLGTVCEFLVDNVLEPAIRALAQPYGLDETRIHAVFAR